MIKWCRGIVWMALVVSAQAEENPGLSTAEQAQLKRDKIVITDHTYKQIFSGYAVSKEPVFITADTVLNAWLVLFEDSLLKLEDQFSWDLPADLDHALNALPLEAPEGIPKEAFEAALKRSKMVLGTASRLMGGAWSGGKEIDDEIAMEVREIEEASKVSLPLWLKAEKTSLEGIDHAVFRPVGFYAETDQLKRYYRAVRWLQTIQFEPERDDHAAAMILIVKALGNASAVTDISQCYKEIMGYPEDIDILKIKDFEGWNRSPSVDGLRILARDPASAMVVLSGRAIPDLKLFAATTSESRPFPDVLEIGSLLGSPMAKKGLGGKAKVGDLINGQREELMEDYSPYCEYMRCLALLFAAPEPGAPAFMKSEAWQRKSLNTALAGWAQLRHAGGLQAKEMASYKGEDETSPVGFVEPNPEFFRMVSRMISETQEKVGVRMHGSPRGQNVQRRALGLIPLTRNLLESTKGFKEAEQRKEEPTPAQMLEYENRFKQVSEALLYFSPAVEIEGIEFKRSPDDVGDASAFTLEINDEGKLISALERISAGENLAVIQDKLEQARKYDGVKWGKLLEISHQLESLAHKQLRGVEPKEDEIRFIQSYGAILSGVMLYQGNAYEFPPDDAPRITSVFNRPGQGFLLAGVGRPREIRVLYPWKGKEIECRGAVMPFYEMRSDHHLTDGEFKKMLDGPDRPKTPEWLKPVTTEK